MENPDNVWTFLIALLGFLTTCVVAVSQFVLFRQNQLQLKKQEIALKKADVIVEKTVDLEKKINGLTDARVKAAKDEGAMDEQRRTQGGSRD